MRPGERPAERLAERALVVVDQLEELFTVATAEERQRFIARLQALRATTRAASCSRYERTSSAR
jgi:Novel STAND NTPase 1